MDEKINKITKGPKVIIVGVASITIVFFLEVLALYYKSEALELFTNKNEPLLNIILPILYFAFLSIINSQLSILFHYIKDKMQVFSLKKSWSTFIPLKIKEDLSQQSEDYFEIIYEQIPTLTGLNTERVEKFVYTILVAIFFVFQMVKNDFYEVLYLVPILVLTASISSEIMKKRYQDSTEEVINERPRIIQWLFLFFRSNREFSFNLRGRQYEKDMKNWLGGRIEGASHKLINNSKITSLRGFYSSLLNDFPYIATICGLIIFSKYKGLGLSSTLIWMGIIDYLVQATESIKDYKDLGIEREAILAQVHEKIIMPSSDLEEESKIPKSKKIRFILNDKSPVDLELRPGIYNIRGGNGSGKTTLWKTLVGVNDDYENWEKEDVNKVRSYLKNKIRLIEKNPTVVPEWESFEKQIVGFNDCLKSDFWLDVSEKINRLLPFELSQFWYQKFIELEKSWIKRDKKEFSSGELIILSFLRIVYFWNEDVKLIVTDECDSFLDKLTRKAFLETMSSLSKKRMVWFISHINSLQASHEGPHYDLKTL